MTTLSKNMKRLMKDQEIKQYWLAKKCHVSQNTISRWVTGACVPPATGLYRIAKALHVTMEYLMEDHDDYDD